jgi:hypothetical protein
MSLYILALQNTLDFKFAPVSTGITLVFGAFCRLHASRYGGTSREDYPSCYLFHNAGDSFRHIQSPAV